MIKVLIIGGYGSFGRWISASLADQERLSVIIAGPSIDKARTFAESLNAKNIECLRLDAGDNSLADILKQQAIDIVVHTAGPFQGQDYRVARACIRAGCHYIDLADSREFVCGITVLDALAREKGVMLISGASTVPAQSSAVIQRFLPEFSQLKSIEYSIVPGYRARKGVGTVASVLSYCGKPVTRLHGGKWETCYGWMDIKRHDMNQTIGKKWVANCDIPDLTLFPESYHGVESVRFYAGLEPGFLQWTMWAMAWLARLRIIQDWSRYAATLTNIGRLFDPLGSHTGGMMMQLAGVDSGGNKKVITWQLTAEEGHGPHIPSIPATILVKKIADGQLTRKGAFPCINFFTLEEFFDAVKHLKITEEIKTRTLL